MGDFVQKPGSGALFKNKNKKEDKHPDYKGDFTAPDGTQFVLAGWKRKTKAEETFLALVVKLKEAE